MADSPLLSARMKWEKLGFVYRPNGESAWRSHSALQPTPFLLDQTTIRVFVGFRDETGASRIGAVDVDAANPTKVIRVSKDPVLDIGEPGTFDDNGVVPCAAVEREGKVYLYYSGYQLAGK